MDYRRLTQRFPLFALAWGIGLFTAVSAQQPVVNFPFDDGQASAGPDGSAPEDGTISGTPQPACGVEEGSILLDGQDDYVAFTGEVNRGLRQADFVISLYFHPVGQTPRQTLIARREKCATDEPGFVVDYLAASRQLDVSLVENADLRLNFQVQLPAERCWYHLILERVDNIVSVFIDGDRVERVSGPDRLNIFDEGVNLELGRAACPQTGSNFSGFVDELEIYSGRLTADEREALFPNPPDRIAPLAFPAVNVGEEVTLEVPNTCATDIGWTPTASILSGADTRTPVVSPEENTTYEVTFGYANSPCVATDEVTLQIFGPNSFDCSQILVPSAFTPDALGPESNETLFISNGAALQEFEVFEIYDRWGNRVFATDEVGGAWDGTYEGEPAMPGPYLWRAAYSCNDEALEATGTTMLIR